MPGPQQYVEYWPFGLLLRVLAQYFTYFLGVQVTSNHRNSPTSSTQKLLEKVQAFRCSASFLQNLKSPTACLQP